MFARLIPFLMVLVLGSPAAAQQSERSEAAMREIFDRGCGDDNGVDRCDSAKHGQMRQLYGVPDPSELLQNGVTLRRAMFVDGYGNDVVSISFLRRPGDAPLVQIHVPQRSGGPSPQLLESRLSNDVWTEVIAASRFFDQQLARELQADDGRSMCLHGWFVVVEAVDAPRISPNVLAGTGSEDDERDPMLPVRAPMDPGTIRTDAESACAQGLANDYAFNLASIALAALPECSTLDGQQSRNHAGLLAQCQMLRGDRLVAGEAIATFAKLNRALLLGNQQEQNWLFVGMGEVRADRFRSALNGGDLNLVGVTGLDADHAEISAQILYGGRQGASYELADVTMKLLRQTGNFVIDTFTVTNRRPFLRGREP